MGMRSAMGRLQKALSRHQWAVAAAVKLRNQCGMVIQYHLGEEGHAELNGEKRVIELVAPGASTFIDVGANVGDWAELFLCASGREKRGLLIEASSSAIAKLQERFEGRAGIRIICAAASDSSGEIEFYEEPREGQTSSLQRSAARPDARTHKVRLTTVDEEATGADFGYVDMLKIDAEGHDFHVLRGASRLLNEGRIGIVQFEYNRPWAYAGSTLSAAISFLKDLRYEVYLLRSTGLHPFDYERYGEFFGYANFVAISPATLPTLRPLIRD